MVWATAATTAASDYATAAQGALADTAVQPAAISNIDNTSDADKPVSTAQQTAIDAVQTDVDNNEAAANTALALRVLLDGTNIPGPYANDAAAATGGVAVGAIYKHDNGQIHYPRELIFRYINLKSVVSRVGLIPSPFLCNGKVLCGTA